MSKINKKGVIKYIEGYDAPIFIFEDSNRFSFSEFKIIDNQMSLLKCRRTSLNGKIQLVYLKDEYKPIKYLYKQMNEEKLIHIFAEICDALIEIDKNGFLQKENIIISVDQVFVNVANLNVKMVYVPISSAGDEDVFSVKELNDFFLELFESADFSNPKLANAIRLISLSKTDLTLEELRHFYKEIINTEKVMPADDALQSQHKENTETAKKGNSVLYLSSSNAGIDTQFRVDQHIFTIGRKESIVDGYIPHIVSIGRMHCQIIKEAGRFFITDLESKNGTFINGVRVKSGEKKEIHNGDSIRLATTYVSAEIREE